MEEPRTKRPIFTPVVLLLLTFSLIGNVFLYTRNLQNAQTDRVDQGTEILQSAQTAKAFLAEAEKQAAAMAGAADAAGRMAAKSSLLASYRNASSVTEFIREAEDVNGKPFPAAKRSAADFMDQTLASLQAIGNHEGPLTDGEKAYLASLVQIYQACQKEMSAFQQDAINQEQALIILVNKDWQPIAGKLLEQMNASADLSFKG
ncbi:hypothetical protein [Paenibacillus sacheonensis]|uniref:Uncharacterized protein n=1 Tax=Paenibacillus sacheonensis TaxID=742054 RepID=A0A7X5C4E7_9BACL|nr:hypothetical protein [Paenibacillus sacheonensis]MBM7565638.1 hypothetical protein [Paenibacillus sacheonensis]NBC72304.1 hypothetical protein [Paenibacillus sacheonensis]